MQSIHFQSRSAQRGAASLFVALVLLLGGTIIAFFANRSFIFEQRTSANQYRATKAFELAEAGSEWALGKLNEKLPLQAGSSCATGGAAAAATFQERYATPTSAGLACGVAGCLAANTIAVPGCRIDNAGVATCDCPTDPLAPLAALGAPAAGEQGRFAVRFATVPGDGSAVEIISRGCVNVVGDTACNPIDPAGTIQSDATATVRQIVKIVPSISSGPAAALTSGSATVTGGNMTVVNNDQTSNGITIHAGTTVNLDGSTQVFSLPGTPPRSSVLDNDPALADLTNSGEEEFFANYFAQTLTDYRDVDSTVIRVGPAVADPANRCNSAAACGAIVTNIVNTDGVREPRFFVYGDLSFNGGTLGSTSNPITLVSNGNIELRGGMTAYGLFYAATATASENWDYQGSGGATIHGAFVSRGSFDNASGNMRLIYDPSLWSTSSKPVGRLVRVPGSWRDKLTNY
jgi:Tfp pilus assembly protein PilX